MPATLNEMRVNLMKFISPAAAASGARLGGIGAAAAVAIGLLSTGAAHADTFVPLPDGTESGPGATVNRTNEVAVISGSMAANGAGRVVWVSGNVIANVTDTPIVTEPPAYTGPANRPGSNNSSTHGVSQVNTGYLVGCQVSISDKAISAGVSVSVQSLAGPSGSGSVGVQLGPGEVKFVEVAKKDIFAPGTYSIGYQDAEINIQGCAGYAQARAYTNVEVIGVNHSKISLYGAPFSIG